MLNPSVDLEMSISICFEKMRTFLGYLPDEEYRKVGSIIETIICNTEAEISKG